MPPQFGVTKIARNTGTQRPTLRPQTEVRSRQAITAGLLSPLLLNYLDKPNVRYDESQGRNWPAVISSVMSNPHSLFDSIIADVEELGEKAIVDEACDLIEKFGQSFGIEDAKQGIAEFFEANTHGKFDPGQMLVHTWGSAQSVVEIGIDLDKLPQNTINNLKEAFQNGYIFLRAAQIAFYESKKSQKIESSLPQIYFQRREAPTYQSQTETYITDYKRRERTTRWHAFHTRLEDEKFDPVRFTALAEITRSLIGSKSLSVLTDRIADGFLDIFPYAEIEVELRSDILSKNYSKPDLQNFPHLSQNGKSGLTSKIIREPTSVEEVNQKMMGLPLLDSGNELLGMIIISLSNGLASFPKSIEHFANELRLSASGMLANMVKMEKLEQETMTDSLTGLGNRRYYEEQINKEFERSRRYKTPLSLLYLDIDFFKKINDTYGHDCGDKVLKELSKILKHETRNDIDTLARIGGEEIVIALPETPHDRALIVAERIRKSVEKHDFGGLGGPKVTVSIGASTLGNHSNSAELLKEADGYLYEAKKTGRNRVIGKF